MLRLLASALLLLILLPANAANPYWEQVPHRGQGASYDEYLNQLGAVSAVHRSRCKDNVCQYWIQIGAQRFSVSKDASILTRTRYRDVTYALYDDGEQLQLIGAGLASRSVRTITDRDLSRCLRLNSSDSIISATGTPLCLSGNTLFIGEHPRRLPLQPDAYRFGSSYAGDWALAIIDTQQKVYVLRAGDIVEVPAGLHSRSDLDHVLSVFPAADGQTWLTVYEYYNKRNKSLMLYRLQDATVRSYTVCNSIEDDTGIQPDLYQTATDELRISSSTLSGQVYFSFRPDNLTARPAVTNPYRQADIGEVLLGIGLRHTRWSVDQAVKEPSNSEGDARKLASVDYQMNESLLTEYRLAGRLFGNQIALSYLKNEAQQDMGALEKAATEKLYGAIAFDDFFSGPSTLRFEYSSELAGGIATYSNNNGDHQQVDFKNDYRRYSLLKTSELGRFAGISYARNNMPMAIGFFESGLSDPLIYFDPDFRLQKLTFVFGFDTAQYASRYLFNYQSLYFDGRAGLGLYQYDIGQPVLAQAEQDSGKHHRSDIGVAFDAYLEGGYLWQLRSANHGGLGVSLQGGVSVDLELYLNGLAEDSKVADDEIVSSFERTDIRWGPFLRLNLMY